MHDVEHRCVYKMAATGCMEGNSCEGEGEEFPCQKALEMFAIARNNSMSNGFMFDDDSELLCGSEDGGRLQGGARPMTTGAAVGDSPSVSPVSSDEMDSSPGRKRRRTLRFDSSESSDSGVASLSNTDSSQSSGTSDITEPCSPPSPDTPRSCTPLPNGFHSSVRNCCSNGQDLTPNLKCDRGSVNLTFEGEVVKNAIDKCAGDGACYGSNCQGPLHCYSDTVLPPDADVVSCLGLCRGPKDPCSKMDVCCAEPCCQEEDAGILEDFLDDTASPKERSSEDSGSLLDDEDDCCGEASPPEIFPKDEPTSLVRGPDSPDGGRTSPPTLVLSRPEDVDAVPKSDEAAAADDKAKAEPPAAQVNLCRWSNCSAELKNGNDVVEHLQGMHVTSQMDGETFVCLWEGCKVYNRSSCSLSWLERHVLTHAGSKPFHCIVDGCGQRFTSQASLERHVNSHFNVSSAGTGSVHSGGSNNSWTRRKDDTPTKIMKKKRLRYRRRYWTMKTKDFFDTGIMECVQHRLVTLHNATMLDTNNSSSAITFHSTVIARRVEGSGKVKVLLRWTPEDVIPDEWVSESQALTNNKQSIPISSIPRDALARLDPTIPRRSRTHRKNRRK